MIHHQHRLEVYISSTSMDLETRRQGVIKAVLDVGYHPVAMENYGAVASPPLDKCRADVRACDVYVLLVAWRYGFVPEGQTESITALEYREAIKHQKKCLVFVLDENAAWPRSMMDRDPTQI